MIIENEAVNFGSHCKDFFYKGLGGTLALKPPPPAHSEVAFFIYLPHKPWDCLTAQICFCHNLRPTKRSHIINQRLVSSPP